MLFFLHLKGCHDTLLRLDRPLLFGSHADSEPAINLKLVWCVSSNRCSFGELRSCRKGRTSQYEIKFDGYRALAMKCGGKVQLRTRNNNDFSVRYPGIVKALAPLRPTHLVATRR